MGPRIVVAAVALGLIGLAAGQLPSLPTSFTHTDYRVTIEVSEDASAETENAVSVKVIGTGGSTQQDVRFEEGKLKERGAVRQKVVSVSANLKMDTNTKIEWTNNGVDAVKVKRFTVSGDGRICYFYPTKDLFVSSGVIGPGGTTTRTDTESVNALECYDLQDFGLLGFQNNGAGQQTSTIYFAGVKYWQGPPPTNTDRIYLKDVGHGNTLAIKTPAGIARPAFFAGIKSIHLNKASNTWVEESDIVTDRAWRCTAGQNEKGVGLHSYMATAEAMLRTNQSAVDLQQREKCVPTATQPQCAYLQGNPAPLAAYTDKGFKVNGDWFSNTYHDFFWSPAFRVDGNNNQDWQPWPEDASSIWTHRASDAEIYCRGTLGLFISSLTPDNGKIDGSTTVSIYGRGFGLNELKEAFPKVNFIGDAGSFDAEVTDRRSSRLLVVRAPRQAGISNKVTYDVKVETLGTEHGFTTGLQEADLLKLNFTYNCGCDGLPGPADGTCSCNANAVYNALVPSI